MPIEDKTVPLEKLVRLRRLLGAVRKNDGTYQDEIVMFRSLVEG